MRGIFLKMASPTALHTCMFSERSKREMKRLLNLDPVPTRKKRKKKKIQQQQREVVREITNRQRDEEAFLGNLLTCKANIYIVKGFSYVPTDISSSTADFTSSITTTQLSCDEPAPTGISWNDWKEGAVMFPFEKRRSNPFFVHEIASDELTEPDHDMITVRDQRRLPP